MSTMRLTKTKLTEVFLLAAFFGFIVTGIGAMLVVSLIELISSLRIV